MADSAPTHPTLPIGAGEFLRSNPELAKEAEADQQFVFFPEFEETKRERAEREITFHQKVVDYDTKEYPVEIIVTKYLRRRSEEDNEIFIPDYQRDFTWSTQRQSKFIESMLIGLPIPYIFVADVEAKEARLEIVDGSQRVRTLAAFITNGLQLEGLEKLGELNGFRFCDLEVMRQRRFLRRTIHVIELGESADENVRRDVFERINTGSDVLSDMEIRRGLTEGPFMELIEECALNGDFNELVRFPEAAKKRREREEYVLRFFAYSECYLEFEKGVKPFLDSFLKEKEKATTPDSKAADQRAFLDMLGFVKRSFPYGFRKGRDHVSTPRIRFEALAVGVALALKHEPNLQIEDLTWLESEAFKKHTTSDASNSKPKVKGRIEYVRDQLLKAAP